MTTMRFRHRTTLILTICLMVIGYSSLYGAALEEYLGKWSLHLPTGAGWLDIRQENGHLDADVLWIGGSVVPVDHIYYADGKIYIQRLARKPVAVSSDRTHQPTNYLELEASGTKLIGRYVEPANDGHGAKSTVFYGTRIPPLPDPPDLSAVTFDDPISLFDGKSLNGWTAIPSERKSAWQVNEGVLINDPAAVSDDDHPRTANLRSDAVFEDFNLTLEVNIPKGSNSGVYLRGIYEVQVMDSYQMELDNHHMGALYSRIKPEVAAELAPGVWQTLDLTLCDRHLTVVLNGKTIIDNQPIEGVTGGALSADQFAPGPIYLQGDHGKVRYRNIILRTIIK
ncbi:MAG: DUF1080 domain-containing protein [Saprospiraceae bacterium]|nr:DUF1080 domain-containing protein [Saprospiraceae bacterium]